jgi:uncharacterized protein (DUF2267 family)
MMTQRISMPAVLERLAEQGLTGDAATLALSATVAVLGERLVDDEARALAEVLPTELAESIEGVEYDTDFSTDELFERVRRRMRTTPARAREDAEIVLAVIGESLGRDVRRRIARGLPEQAAAIWLGTRELGEPPGYRTPPRAPAMSTLASARPGSTHPLSEAAPPSGHTHSVARNPSPHEETKLSGAKGTTQERLDETLGAGRPPGPARPVADAGRDK